MANGDRQKIDFTVADRVRSAEILDNIKSLKDAFERYQNKHDKDHEKIDIDLKDTISKKGVAWVLGVIVSIIVIGGTIIACI